jgi:predicted AlkP superfamily pyrophosphatase or phosphodiesterase
MSLLCSGKPATPRFSFFAASAIFLLLNSILLPASWAAPKVVLISLDGATPRIVNGFLQSGVLPRRRGIGELRRQGFFAEQNIVIAPSLTAASHIAIATGSTAARNDVVSNTFHLVASPFTSNVSGFSAPIGGYSIDGPAESPNPTAFPIWHSLRAAGKTVVTATFPGGDGLDVRVPGLPAGGPIVQPASVRTVDYTVPFGEFGGVGGSGFTLAATDFAVAPAMTIAQLTAAGKTSFSPVLQKVTPLESFAVGGVSYTIQVAALDTTNDSVTNYDTLVFFDSTNGIQPGPFTLPSTGPAYVKASDHRSSRFFLEGSPKKAGCAFYVTVLAPDLSTVHLARYTVNDIPPNPAVQADVDDVNNNVGFWADQEDFRFPERINPGLANFSDQELEGIGEDQNSTFVDYQTRLALRAIERFPDADLVMVYIEEPDGFEHQYLLTDSRQASNPLDPNSIGHNQDPVKVARYAGHIQSAYRVANEAVAQIMDAVSDGSGDLQSNVIVVSDHGFDPFHTAVSAANLLASAGIPSTKVRAVTSGPAVNFYINLIGREPNGTVAPAEFVTLQKQILQLVRKFSDTNAGYAGKHGTPVFDKIYARPVPSDLTDPGFGRGTAEFIGQDSGDVFAMLTAGYNFDGTQSPVVQRLGDATATAPVLSVPNFYGAHGYDPQLKDMSAILFAAGPDVRPGSADLVHNIDVAPTIGRILGVKPDNTVQGHALDNYFKKGQ